MGQSNSVDFDGFVPKQDEETNVVARKEYSILLEGRSESEGFPIDTLWKNVHRRLGTSCSFLRKESLTFAESEVLGHFRLEDGSERIRWKEFLQAFRRIRDAKHEGILRLLRHCSRKDFDGIRLDHLVLFCQITCFLARMESSEAETKGNAVAQGCWEELHSGGRPRNQRLAEEEIRDWMSCKLPGILDAANGFMESILFPDRKTNHFVEVPNEEVRLVLLSSSEDLLRGQDVHCLYDSRQDGSSLSRLFCKAEGYPGPLLLEFEYSVLEGATKHKRYVSGALIDGEMVNTREFYGKGRCTLYAFSPSFHVYHTLADAKSRVYSYSRPPLRSSGHLKGWEGLGFGGMQPAECRLALDKDFDTICFRHWMKDDSYERGGFFPSQDCKLVEGSILRVQAFGLGGPDASRRMSTIQRQHAKFIEERRKVDLKKFADDWRSGGGDKALLGMMAQPDVLQGERAEDLRKAGPAG